MTSSRKRMALLLGACGVLAIVVVMDSGGDAASADDVAKGGGAAERYAKTAEQLAALRAVADRGPDWQEALSASEQAMTIARSGMLKEVSAELAAARLRDRIVRDMQLVGLRPDTTSAGTPRSPVEGAPIRVVSLQVRFQSPNSLELHSLIERLEAATDVRLHVSRLVISGPGQSVAEGLSVDLTVEALALVSRGTGV